MEKEDAHFCLRCRTTIVGLDEYVSHRKADLCRQQQLEVDVCSQRQLEAEVCRQEESLFIPQSQEDGEAQDRLASPHFSTTAADALASEAAFMESIGLYLNPKPSLQLARVPGINKMNVFQSKDKIIEDIPILIVEITNALRKLAIELFNDLTVLLSVISLTCKMFQV